MSFVFATQIVQAHLSLLKTDLDRVTNLQDILKLPFFEESSIELILTHILTIFQNEELILNLNLPIIVIGDIHGQLLDLYRILIRFGLPPSRSYLFLGDLIDRGEFSLETICFIFSLKIIYPRNIYIIRGNHEFDDCSSIGGFQKEIIEIYKSNNLYLKFLNVFNYLSIGAILFEKIICFHGGLSPTFLDMKQILLINRPINSFKDPLLNGIFWSDPSNECIDFGDSRRLYGYTFGFNALKNFLINNNFELLIRGHECIKNGFEYKFKNNLLTVFSASNYCGTAMNFAAVIAVFGSNEIETIQMPPLKYLFRNLTINIKYSPEEFPLHQLHNITIPKKRKSISKTTRPKNRILDLSHSSIPVGNPILALKNQNSKIKLIARVREIDSCQLPSNLFENDFV